MANCIKTIRLDSDHPNTITGNYVRNEKCIHLCVPDNYLQSLHYLSIDLFVTLLTIVIIIINQPHKWHTN